MTTNAMTAEIKCKTMAMKNSSLLRTTGDFNLKQVFKQQNYVKALDENLFLTTSLNISQHSHHTETPWNEVWGLMNKPDAWSARNEKRKHQKKCSKWIFEIFSVKEMKESEHFFYLTDETKDKNPPTCKNLLYTVKSVL